jgi:nucleoid-associated protein YgaU
MTRKPSRKQWESEGEAMTRKKRVLLSAVVVVLALMTTQTLVAQQMTKDQWQEEMRNYTARKADLQAQLAKLEGELKEARASAENIDNDIRACEDALFALLGVTREEYEAFMRDLEGMEKRVTELQAMSDAQLMNYSDEIMRMDRRAKEMAQHKIAMIPRIKSRISDLQNNIAGLLKTLRGREKTYTVGTWSRDRDCLWNIAKKKDIYANAWMWPKIWQGNRDKIKDPDIIQPKWVLKIPAGSELSKEEKSAANSYYRKKAAAAASGAGN